MTRRSPLAVVLMCALVLAACAGSGNEESATATTAPEDMDESTDAAPGSGTPTTEPAVSPDPIPGGTLRYAAGAVGPSLDPTSTEFTAAERTVVNTVFDTLTAIDVDGRPVPYLAESLTPVGGDLSVWQVTLRPDITFHDGTPLDAAAVVANFEAQRADPGIGVVIRADYVPDQPVTVVDEQTVEYRLLDPSGAFPARLAGQEGIIASAAWLEATVGDPTLRGRPIGTGPYTFADRTDRFLRVDRNPTWWGGDVYIDAIEFIDDDAGALDAVALLDVGELDGLQSAGPTELDRLAELDGVQTTTEVDDEVALVMLNTESPPFDDPVVRRALTLATPLDVVRQALGGEQVVAATQRFAPDSPYFDPRVEQVGDVPEDARTLLFATCIDTPDRCVDGRIGVELQYPVETTPQPAIDALVDGWTSVGFDVDVQPLSAAEHQSQIAFGEFNATLWRQFGAVDPSADNAFLLCRNIADVSLNWTRLCDLARDAELLEAQRSADPNERTSAYQTVSATIAESNAYVFLTHDEWAYAFGPNVGGVCARTAPDGAVLACAAPAGGTWLSQLWFTG
ncbi:MAG: ABC transporter substrate-binding protein [Actinomycetota bacterium]